MSTYIYKQTNKTPDVYFDSESGVLEIKGKSIPENAREIFKPVMDELEEYSKNPKPTSVCNINLEYYNTSTSMWIFQFFKKLSELTEKQYEVIVNWYYMDEDILDAGMDFQALIPLKFNMIAVN